MKGEKYIGGMYVLFRLIVGGLFMLHGVTKYGLLGGSAVEMGSLLWFAGVIETVGGLFLVLGLFTRVVAAICAAEMLVAYFMAHFPQGWSPLANKGEPALLFFAAFLVLAGHGAWKWSLDNVWFKK